MKPKKILLIRIDRLGDFILTIPFCNYLKKKFPQANIDIIINKTYAHLAYKLQLFNNIISFSPQSFLNKINLTCFHHLCITSYDIAFDLIPGTNIFSSTLLFLSRSKEKIGYAVGIRKFFLTKHINPSTLKYESILVLDLLKTITLQQLPVLDLKKEFHILQKIIDKNYQKMIFKKYVTPKDISILIHPGLGIKDIRRYWKPEYYAKLIEKIIKHQPNTKIFITGQKEDIPLIQNITSHTENTHLINFAGKTNLTELISLIDLADIIICPLTGVTHVAAALQKKLITLHGPTPLTRWTTSELHYGIISTHLPCSPCEHLPACIYKGTHKHLACMTSLTPEIVFQKLKPLLSKTL